MQIPHAVMRRPNQQPKIRAEHADRAARIAKASEELFLAVTESVSEGMSLQEAQFAQGLAPSIREERRKQREAQARAVMAHPNQLAEMGYGLGVMTADIEIPEE